MLKLTGVACLATPNRLWPWEVHNKVPLLHYLPHAVFHWMLRRLGKYREDVIALGKARRFLQVRVPVGRRGRKASS